MTTVERERDELKAVASRVEDLEQENKRLRRTIDALRTDKRRRIARETLDIYAPIAERLGLNSIRIELEDQGFKALYPNRHKVLAAELRKSRGHRKQVIRKIETGIKRRLRQEDLKGSVAGREKHMYSLYQKMLNKQLSFSEVKKITKYHSSY